MYTQIPLPYSYDALEPAIDALTVETHYTKHHATYTKKLNGLAQEAGLQDLPIEQLLAECKQRGLSTAIRNNAGGFYNHNLYFSQLAPNSGGAPTGTLATAIDTAFGSFDAFKQQIGEAAVNQFGSGYAWLNTDKSGTLTLSQSPNQDNPVVESEGKLTPILCIDVWEHAYYLKYKNLRPTYIENFFSILNWPKIAENYENAQK